MNRRGDQRDVKVRQYLEKLGFTLGSRRKIPGPGDLLAIRVRDDYSGHVEVLLVEVKSTAQGPWEHFGPSERLALAEAAQDVNSVGAVAWWPSRGPLSWFVVVDEEPGTPWSGPGKLSEYATTHSSGRGARLSVVAPPPDGSGVVGPGAAG
jgi:hypothetical protein